MRAHLPLALLAAVLLLAGCDEPGEVRLTVADDGSVDVTATMSLSEAMSDVVDTAEADVRADTADAWQQQLGDRWDVAWTGPDRLVASRHLTGDVAAALEDASGGQLTDVTVDGGRNPRFAAQVTVPDAAAAGGVLAVELPAAARTHNADVIDEDGAYLWELQPGDTRQLHAEGDRPPPVGLSLVAAALAGGGLLAWWWRR